MLVAFIACKKENQNGYTRLTLSLDYYSYKYTDRNMYTCWKT